MSHSSFSGNFGGPSGGDSVKARIKWFNPDKGFGFVAPVDGSPDAFLHVSALQRHGLSSVPEGAEIECEIGQGPKGQQVLRVISIDTSVVPDLEPAGDEPSLAGSVKWFAPEKGFGFIAADDGGKDVFIHKSVLRRCGIQVLDEGQRVQVIASATAKGREATWIAIEA